MSKFTINQFTKQHTISMLTAYDFHSARLAEEAGINAILVGDSLGMVIQGANSTINVTLEDIIYHTKLVCKGAPNTFIIADMPYLTYHNDINTTISNATRIIKETNAHALKLEVNHASIIPHIEALIAAQIPVMGHLGLTPQSVNLFGGFKVQGKNYEEAEKIYQLALALEQAKCFSLVLECIPAQLSEIISQKLSIPTIGIGSGNKCAGQILVFHDLIGITNGSSPKFVKHYLDGNQIIKHAIKNYISEINNQSFPTENHSY